MGSKSNDAKISALNTAMNEQEGARNKYEEVTKPDYEKIRDYIELAAAENPDLIGLLEKIERDPSALEDIVSDPSLRGTQAKALEALKQAGESGFTEEDMAERRELTRDVESGEKARQSSILQQMAQRGQSGSGAELAARLSSSQAATQRAAESTDRLATDSAAARRQALMQASQAAGSLRGQDRKEATQLASARDQIAQFNAMNRQNINNQNLQMQQARENQRSGQQQAKYGQLSNLQQQQYANEMQEAGAYNQATASLVDMQQRNVRQSSGPMGAIGAAAGTAIGAYFGGPQGAAAGGQIGGALGNASESNDAAYADGGIKRQEHTPSMDDYSARYEKERFLENELNDKFEGNRYHQAIYGDKNRGISTEDAYHSLKQLLPRSETPSQPEQHLDPATVQQDQTSPSPDYRDLLATLKINSNNSDAPQERQLQRSVAPASMPQMPMDDPALRSRKLMAADGGVKYGGITDTQADQLRAEIASMDRNYADGGMKSMAYNDGGEGTIIDSGEEMYAGDELEDNINDGEIVLNVEQQDRINDKLMELKRLQSSKRTDTMLDEGEKEINHNQQEALMSVARGEMDVEELPNDRIVKEPTGGMGEFMALLSKSKRR